jgi:hypothetical protein
MGPLLACVELTSTRAWPGTYDKTEMKEDGEFAFRNVRPGSCRLAITLSGDIYVKSARLGPRDVLKEGVEIAIGGTSHSLEVVLSSYGARLDGTVLSGAAINAACAKAILVPELDLRGVRQYYKWTGINSDGSFKFRGIRPGSYKLFAWKDIDISQLFDPHVVQTAEDRGITVELKDGDVKLMEHVLELAANPSHQ